MKNGQFSRRVVLGMASSLAAGSAFAAYPDRPITMIVPFAAGGSTDTGARLIANKMSEILGKQIVIENRPGGGGNVGASELARARRDGYTIMMGALASLVSGQHTPGVNFRFPAAFTPISLTVDAAYVLLASPQQPFNTVRELVEYDKANPGKLNIGSAGMMSGQHLVIEDFKTLTGLSAEVIHFQGNSPVMNALIANTIEMTFDAANIGQEFVNAGKVKAIAYTGDERSPFLPTVPTVAETYPGFNAGFALGIFAPAGIDADVLRTLSEAAQEAGKDPALVERYRSIGMRFIGSTPADFSRFIAGQVERTDRLVERLKAAGAMQ